jgi:hypothetical protein
MDSQLVGLATVSFIFPEAKQVGCISTSRIAQIRSSLQGALRVFLDVCWGEYKTVLRCPTLSGMQLLKWQEQQPAELNTTPQQYIRHVLFFPYIQNGTQTCIKMYQHKISLCIPCDINIRWTSNVQMEKLRSHQLATGLKVLLSAVPGRGS